MKRLARSAYRALIGVVVGAYAIAERLQRNSRRDAGTSPRRILVLRFGLLGDGVNLTPALRLVRQSFPLARIDVVATPIQVAVLDGLPAVDRVVVWRAGDLSEPRLALSAARWMEALRCVRELRRERYDVALSCYGPLSSAVALFAGARTRAGFDGEALPATLTAALPGRRFDRPWHDAEYCAAVARAAGAKGPTPRTEVCVSPQAVPRVTRLLEERGPGSLGSKRRAPPVIVHPGATNGTAKRWPVAHWRSLVARLIEDGRHVVIVGHGPSDAALAREITAGLPPSRAGQILDAVDRTTTHDLIALLAQAQVVVSGDSGPVHLAAALRRPAVAIYGPTDPALMGPFQAPEAVVVRHPLPCSPCYRLDRVAECPLGHTLCQHQVAPATVYRAIGEALDRSSKAC